MKRLGTLLVIVAAFAVGTGCTQENDSVPSRSTTGSEKPTSQPEWV